MLQVVSEHPLKPRQQRYPKISSPDRFVTLPQEPPDENRRRWTRWEAQRETEGDGRRNTGDHNTFLGTVGAPSVFEVSDLLAELKQRREMVPRRANFYVEKLVF